jgi:hypothetical protein
MIDVNGVALALKKEFPVPEIDPVCLFTSTELTIAMGSRMYASFDR